MRTRISEGFEIYEIRDELPLKKGGLFGACIVFGAHLLLFTAASRESSYLVDPASSHMLVSKIKPCMSKYKQVCTVKLRMAH